jgi:hypothetical protein
MSSMSSMFKMSINWLIFTFVLFIYWRMAEKKSGSSFSRPVDSMESWLSIESNSSGGKRSAFFIRLEF